MGIFHHMTLPYTLSPYFTSAHYSPISKPASFYSKYDLETHDTMCKCQQYYCCLAALKRLLVLGVRATGTPDSRRILSDITVYNYDTTHLQENPQRLG